MTHHCFFEIVRSLPNGHFRQALLQATASNRSHNVVHYYKSDWQMWIAFAIFVEKSVLFSWPADNMKSVWVCTLVTERSACGCVYVTVYGRHMFAVWWLLPLSMRRRKKKKKMAVYFRMLDFRPRSSMNTAAYKLRGEICRVLGCTVTFRVVFLVECGSEGVRTVCLWWEAHLQEIGIFHIKQSSNTCAFSVLLWKQEHQVTELSEGWGRKSTIWPLGEETCLFFYLNSAWMTGIWCCVNELAAIIICLLLSYSPNQSHFHVHH